MFWRDDSPIITHQWGGMILPVNLAFDRVLTMFDVLDDTELHVNVKFEILFELFTDVEGQDIPLNTRAGFVLDMLKTQLEIDLQDGEDDKEQPLPVFDYSEDSDRIYASFLQDYRMDLYEQQGRLTWKTFHGLLFNLSENTPFQQAVHYRTCKVPKQDKHNKEEVRRIQKLKKFYALKNTRYADKQGEQQLNKAMAFLQQVQSKSLKKKGGN